MWGWSRKHGHRRVREGWRGDFWLGRVSYLQTGRTRVIMSSRGACKLSHTTTCVYVCIYLFWVEHLTNNLFYQTERRSLWTSCETPLTFKKIIYSKRDLKLVLTQYDHHDKHYLIYEVRYCLNIGS